MQRKFLLKLLLALTPLFLGACMLMPIDGGLPVTDPGAIHTAAAQTIVAQVTLSAGETAVAQLTSMASGGMPTGAAATLPVATSTPVASPTLPPPQQATAIPSFTPPPTWTAIPPLPTAIPTWTAIPPLPTRVPPTWAPPPPPPTACDWVQFVKDVTVPDGSVYAPGAPFTKVWRLRNIGSCNWNGSYSLVFVSGDRMQVRNVYPLPGVVRPNETVDLSADFVAPASAGRYRGYWMLSNASGRTFGIGADTQKPFWVDITVKSTSTGEVFDFAANLCAAEWYNRSRSLPCPGNSNSDQGSVVLLSDPTLETGKHENEPAIWTRPEQGPNGMIAGAFPAFRVRAGDHFMADIGCLENSKRCDVVFYLDYQVADGPARNLGSWHEVYDGKINRVDVDLSSLAGERVRLTLRVENRGNASAANAFWLVPGVRRGSTGGNPGGNPGWGDLPAVQAAVQKLAHDLGISTGQISVTLVEKATWSDACLGIYIDGQVCAQVVVPGYRIMLSAAGQRFEAHTDDYGNTVFWVMIY